ncbi:MAG: hypothetical protein ALECFALPRED_001797 [Alectoria fallacina]|uniref:Uncharacterized protein n=1 Tax=Alectoria fallacina TaxID=1903189 RepID=A0A8H3FD87_9LECA|nr:MAG: hypothetical protein ALECFALPRED_001797 [Alectoria fallacina]
MGKAKNELKDFIANIPNAKLTGFPSSETTIYKTSNLRFDMQTVTTKDPRCYNLQVQINKHLTITSLKRFAGEALSIALVPVKGKAWTPAEIRAELEKNRKI